MSAVTDFTFNDALRAAITNNVADFQDDRHAGPPGTPAAVAVTIFEHEDEGAIIVTRRAARLKAHSGQWAMPGGRVDPGETIFEAALRELHEEVNLDLDPGAILGTLDDYPTRSGFVITPVVVWTNIEDVDLVPNPGEVDSIHPFTFTELMRDDSPNLEDIPESDRKVLSMNYLDDRIYAPTAAMLYQFREVALKDIHTRVSHFDAPVFAWS